MTIRPCSCECCQRRRTADAVIEKELDYRLHRVILAAKRWREADAATDEVPCDGVLAINAADARIALRRAVDDLPPTTVTDETLFEEVLDAAGRALTMRAQARRAKRKS